MRRELPTGAVTLLFSDVEGSTRRAPGEIVGCEEPEQAFLRFDEAAATKGTTSWMTYCSKFPVTGESTYWPQP